MKKLYTLSLLFFLVSSSVVLGQRLSERAPELLLVQSTRYAYDSDLMALVARDSVSNIYEEVDGTGQLYQQLMYNYVDTSATWVHEGRWTISYDATQRPLENLYELAEDTTYKNDRRYLYTYNAEGQTATYTFEKWSQTEWIIDFQWSYSYNSNGLEELATQQVWDGAELVNKDQRASEYDAENRLTKRVFRKWQNDAWLNDKQDSYTFDGAGLLLEIVTEKWNGSAWELFRKDVFEEYDNEDNPTLVVKYAYLAGVWIPIGRSISIYDYEMGDEAVLVQRLNQVLDVNTGEWVDNTQIFYYYEEFDFSANVKEPTGKLEAFPNPSSDGHFVLDLEGVLGTGNLEVYSSDGRLITTVTVVNGRNELFLNHLGSGVYLLRLQENGKLLLGKWTIIR